MSDPRTVDCRGQACPQPVISAKEALSGVTTPLLVIVDNEGSCTNVTRFAESQGAAVSVEKRDGDYHITITPGEEGEVKGAPSVVCQDAGGTVVLVGSETMGRGDDELGSILMAAFLDTLSQFQGEITHVVFVNSGARLAVHGSPVLDQIRQLEQTGARVLVCGTCLKHFGLTDDLAVGSVSNMYAIIETLTRAMRVIRP
jgi:selenium metabolism protein YedF